MIYLIADTHGSEIRLPNQPVRTLIHLGDYISGEILCPVVFKKVLVKGNHDTLESERKFDFACDGLIIDNLLLTHEPVERLPKGCHFNICGHLHDNNWEDYGFERKPFHVLLEPNRLYTLDEVKGMCRHD